MNGRECRDKDRKVMGAYYDLCERYNGRNSKSIKRALEGLIERDPDFLDSYLLLYQILQDEGDLQEAEKILNEAYGRALNLIVDEKGNWPGRLEWIWLGNRHIIRAILSKAISLWAAGDTGGSLDLFRKLLKANPGDNVGARDYILAIRMSMSYDKFEARFNKDGYYDSELVDWFDRNYKKFPDEFGWWEKAVEEHE